MKIKAIHEAVHRITTPYYGGGTVYLYLIRGDQVALVDTGGAACPQQVIQPALAQLGMAFTDVDLILNTHAHLDHIGGNAEARRLSGAQIFVPAADLPMAESVDAEVEFHLTPLRVLEFDQEWLQTRGEYIRHNAGEAAGADRVVNDGDVIDLGAGIRLRVVACPGHTPGHVAYYWERTGYLFSGDAVQGQGARPGVWPYYFDAPAYRRSLATLAALAPQTLCMAHAYLLDSMAINEATRRGEEARSMLQESAQIADTIHRAVVEADARLPGASKRQVALAALADLIYEVPQLHDRKIGMPRLAGATLLAHIDAARAGTYPA